MSAAIPPQSWRLLITPPMTGAWNMAIDEAILHALLKNENQPERRPTLRFYQWQPACLSLGFSQSAGEVDEVACQDLGYTWVRRPTGGRSILHTDELTYSIITPDSDPRVQGGIIPAYRALSRGLLAGLQRLGAQAVQAEGDMPQNPNQGTACFDTPSHYEVTLNGKKLVGSAQLRRKGIVLQHGTLPLYGDLGRIFDVLNMDEPAKGQARPYLLDRATTLERELGRQISFEAAAEALAAGFAETLNLILIPGPLTGQEKTYARQFHDQQYAHDDWNRRR